MHDPYRKHEVLKAPSQVDSIAADGSCLICGTKQGDLIVYNVAHRDDTLKPDVHLLRYHKLVYKKPIQQLAIVPVHKLLIILTDYTIFVHDLSTFNLRLITTMNKTKGAALFAVDTENQAEKSLTGEKSYIVRLCVSVKKKLQLYYWKNNNFFSFTEDILLNDVPKTLALCRQSICVGFKSEYVYIQVEHNGDKVFKDLFPTGKNLEPYVIRQSDSTFALIKDNQSVFVDTAGNLLTNNTVKWTEVPVATAYDEPYLLSLLNEMIEVKTMQPSLLVQHIQIPSAQLICQTSSGILYVLAGKHIYLLQAIPVTKQMKMLLEEKQFQLAMKLCNISADPEEEKAKQRHDIQTLYAYDLFYNKQYAESMKQFLELNTDPYDVIRLYPNLLPQYTSNDSADSQMATLQNRDLDKSLQALIEYLTEVRLNLLSNVTNKCSPEVEETLKMIDTTLLKCYVNTNDALIAPLLRLNNCHIEDSEKVLKKHKKYSELIILYQTKGFHQKALDLLERHAEQADSPLRGIDKTIQYLQSLGKDHVDLILRFSTWVLEKYSDEALKIFIDDIPEVEQLPRLKVYEHLQKVRKSLVIPYLEYVIYNWDDQNPRIHNVLAFHYREKVVQLCTESSIASEKLVGLNIRNKLINFLETSEFYTPETVLAHFPFDGLHEERAILLGKLKQHNQALAIYVMILNDVEKAVQYCDKVYEQGGPDAQQVYISLLQLLIKPSDNWLVGVTPTSKPSADLEMALNVLENKGARIPPESALSLLPKDVSVSRIKQYLSVSLSELLMKKRASQILRGLLYSEYLQVQELRIGLESENFIIEEWITCPVCKKRFSNQRNDKYGHHCDVEPANCEELRYKSQQGAISSQ